MTHPNTLIVSMRSAVAAPNQNDSIRRPKLFRPTNLRQARLSAGANLTEAGVRIGIAPSSLSQIERLQRLPTDSERELIEDYCGKTIDALLAEAHPA